MSDSSGLLAAEPIVDSTSGPFSLAHRINHSERYTQVKEIGFGGTGVIYQAWDEVLGKFVALKSLGFPNPDLEQQLQREAAIAQQLTHPSLLRIHDLTTFRGMPCLSMELVPCPSLAELLRKQGILDLATVSLVVSQICGGLEAMHTAGIVHCDLKPANILWDQAKHRVYIVDFGAAIRLIGSDHSFSSKTSGTPVYMSPEQRNQLPVDHRADLYVVGLILFELLSGRRPAPAELERMSVKSIRGLLKGVPPRIQRIIAKCLQPHVGDRYHTAAEILVDWKLANSKQERRSKQKLRSQRSALHRVWGALAVMCLCAGLYGYRFAETIYPSQGKLITIAVLPVQADPSLEAITDGVDDYLQAVLKQCSGLELWTVAPTSHPHDQTVYRAQIVLRSQLTQNGEWLTFHLTAEQSTPKKSLLTMTVRAKTVSELENRIGQSLSSTSSLALVTIPAVKPAEYRGKDTASSLSYLLANHLLRRQRNMKDMREVVDRLNRLLNDDPQCLLCLTRKAAAELRLADLNRDAGWLRDATKDVQKAMAIRDSSELVRVTAAQVYARTGHRKEAIVLLRQMRQDGAGSAACSRLLGGLLADEGLYSEAITELQQAIHYNPLDVRSWNALGTTEQMLPDYEAAINAYQTLLLLEPESSFGSVNLAGAYLRAGRFEEAVKLLQTLVERQGTAANYSNLGMALYFTGQGRLALPYFQQAVTLEPKSEIFVGNLAHAYRWLRADMQARVTYQRAITLALEETRTQASGRVWADLGLYAAALGEKDLFSRYFEQARAESSSDLDIQYKEAIAASLLGFSDRSFALLRKLTKSGYAIARAEHNPDLSAMRQHSKFSSWLDQGSPVRNN